MNNLSILLVLVSLLGSAILIGHFKTGIGPTPRVAETVPHMGSVQILNGCGEGGAANAVADFLRSKGWDVKEIGNAPTWKYPFSIVVARTADMTNARQIAAALKTDKLILMRTDDNPCEVDVFVGRDYPERIR